MNIMNWFHIKISVLHIIGFKLHILLSVHIPLMLRRCTFTVLRPRYILICILTSIAIIILRIFNFKFGFIFFVFTWNFWISWCSTFVYGSILGWRRYIALILCSDTCTLILWKLFLADNTSTLWISWSWRLDLFHKSRRSILTIRSVVLFGMLTSLDIKIFLQFTHAVIQCIHTFHDLFSINFSFFSNLWILLWAMLRIFLWGRFANAIAMILRASIFHFIVIFLLNLWLYLLIWFSITDFIITERTCWWRIRISYTSITIQHFNINRKMIGISIFTIIISLRNCLHTTVFGFVNTSINRSLSIMTFLRSWVFTLVN